MASPEYRVFRGANLVGIFNAEELTEAYQQMHILDDDLFITNDMNELLPIHVLEIEKNPPMPPIPRMQQTASRISTTIMGLMWLVGVVLLITGGAWLGDKFLPLVNLVATIILLLGLPIALVLLIFRKTGGAAGWIFFIISLPWAIWLWLASFVYAISTSLLWSVIGVVLGGIGIIPVAVIMMLMRADWENLWPMLISTVAIIVFRWIGYGIIGRADERRLIDGLLAARTRNNQVSN